MKENIKLTEMETLFLALADKTRLRLLNLMRAAEVCVYLFTEVLGESQPKISRHLAYLRNAGIVETRREGKLMYYRIISPTDKHAEFILNDVLDWLENQNEMQKEFDKLNRIHNPADNSDETTYKLKNISAQANTSDARREIEIFLL